MAPGPSIVVGIDFGTTFSGIAWAFEGFVDEIEVISSWPGEWSRGTSVKVPSAIAYHDQKVQWGYQVRSSTEAFRGVKLLLDEGQVLEYAPSINSKELLDKSKKTAVDVTANYLKHLLEYFNGVLQRRLGKMVEDMDLRYILTVPAVWSDKAKDSTLEAALQAGVQSKDISLVSEPEAAALYALRAIRPNSVNKNDVFIVCDAGGGTVDIISYQIKTLEPLTLEEVTNGDGCVCGSTRLDAGFTELLQERMGQEGYSSLTEMSKETAMTYWQDRAKPNFAGRYDDDFADVDYFVPLPGAEDDPDAPIEDGFFQLSSHDIEGIFDPVVREVEDLIDKQMAGIAAVGHSAEAVILVGGFGSSEYLFRRLQKNYPGVDILQPSNAWSAVVSGAVHRGLDGNRVESRIARRHYGVEVQAEYQPDVHAPDERVWDSLEEKYFVAQQLTWHIQKSSKLCENEPIKIRFYRAIPTDYDRSLVFHDDLKICNDEEAPSAMNKNVMRLCTLEADLSKVPRDLFKKKRNSRGDEYYDIRYNLVMTPTSASLIFELEFNGVSYGSVRSKY